MDDQGFGIIERATGDGTPERMRKKTKQLRRRLGVGRKKSMELKITGYGKIPSILTIVSIFCSQVVKLLAFFFWS